MSLLVISPDFASHYAPLAVLARAAACVGHRVVVATGPNLHGRVEFDGFEWRSLRLGASSNGGVVTNDPTTREFIAATKSGPLATIRYQALKREHDLLWNPECVTREVAELCREIEPDEVLVDHVSFGSTLAMRATGRSFVTLVPGHPSQLPVGNERYGIPPSWPSQLRPDPKRLADVEAMADRVTAAFTARWNEAHVASASTIDGCEDAFRVHGRRVLYNSIAVTQDQRRCTMLPPDPQFVGPLVRDEVLPSALASWTDRTNGRPQIYVALGTFLSHRGDVLRVVVDALRLTGARGAVAVGDTPIASLGEIPPDWFVARQLPQVAMLEHTDLIIHHGGNNSVQEALASGVHQIVLPFSTDQFANSADLERTGLATVLSPNEMSASALAGAIRARVTRPSPPRSSTLSNEQLVSALFD